MTLTTATTATKTDALGRTLIPTVLLPTLDFPPTPGLDFGELVSPLGVFPLADVSVEADITGLYARVVLTQRFTNAFAEPVEAVYTFPLPSRAAVTDFELTTESKKVVGELHERGEARKAYQKAIAAGHQAALAEEDRPSVFSLQLGNLPAGEEATVKLTMVMPLEYDLGEATFRFPFVVAPRYTSGTDLDGPSVGTGVASDTDEVQDASRVTPPLLAPGTQSQVSLALVAKVSAPGVTLADLKSSQHAIVTKDKKHATVVKLDSSQERLNRDFILRFTLTPDTTSQATSGKSGTHDALAQLGLTSIALVTPDAPVRKPTKKADAKAAKEKAAQFGDGTVSVSILPPADLTATRPRDVVVVLDHSGSMGGWKIAAARRAASRIVDSLSSVDRFAVVAFDHNISFPGSTLELRDATDVNRFQAVEFLANLNATGTTEMGAALQAAGGLLAPAATRGRDAAIVLVTDGQISGEDAAIRRLTTAAPSTRVFTLGIDRAVNEGFLRRLATLTGGRCELVESEDRLDATLVDFHRRIASPLIVNVKATLPGSTPIANTSTPAIADVFDGAPASLALRYTGQVPAAVTLSGDVVGADGQFEPFSVTLAVTPSSNQAATSLWARALVRDLEDSYVRGKQAAKGALGIVSLSKAFKVLCRHTAFLAVDDSRVVDGEARRIIQPVELADGWDQSFATVNMMSVGAPMSRSLLGSSSMTSSMTRGGGTYSGSSKAIADCGDPGGIGQASATGWGGCVEDSNRIYPNDASYPWVQPDCYPAPAPHYPQPGVWPQPSNPLFPKAPSVNLFTSRVTALATAVEAYMASTRRSVTERTRLASLATTLVDDMAATNISDSMVQVLRDLRDLLIASPANDDVSKLTSLVSLVTVVWNVIPGLTTHTSLGRDTISRPVREGFWQ